MLAHGAEGASNPGRDLYVINNTFLNEDGSRGTFVLVGSTVTTPVLLQNNIFSGTGTLSTQVSTIDKTNYRSVAPGFVDRAAYDLRPTANAMVINAGSVPGVSTSGVALKAGALYRHVASGTGRVTVGAIAIGAYEANCYTDRAAIKKGPQPRPLFCIHPACALLTR